VLYIPSYRWKEPAVEKQELIHTRNITVNTYEVGDNRLMIEGILKDDRFFPSYFYSAKRHIDPGAIHHIIIRMNISLPEIEITGAEAEMAAVPNDICREVENLVEKLVGLRIKRGFTQKIRTLIGGTNGCLHMANLIISMGSAAIQGQWAYYSRNREGHTVRVPEVDLSLLLNSCWLWRENGPYYSRIIEMRRQQDKKKTE
jgi:hypothetical protein